MTLYDHNENGLGRIEVRTLPLPPHIIGESAAYLYSGKVLVTCRLKDDTADPNFIRLAVMEDDGTGFHEIFHGTIPPKKGNGIRYMPFPDNQKIHLGSYILECTPDIDTCRSASLIPVEYPWDLETNPAYFLIWSEIIVSQDNEHVCWTTLGGPGGCIVGVGKLKREENKYTIGNPQVVSSSERYAPDPDHEGCLIPLPIRGGEVKQFVNGGSAISLVGSGRTGSSDSVVQDLSSERLTRITNSPSYEETTIFSPDEKLGIVMTSCGSRANTDIFGLLPRPFAAAAMGITMNLYLYTVTGVREFREGNIGPMLIDIGRSSGDPDYRGVLLNDPEEKWVYHSPMSWHPSGKKAMWPERVKSCLPDDGNGRFRVRIAELLDYVPGPAIPAAPVPDTISYALPEPDANAGQEEKQGKIAGKHSGFVKFIEEEIQGTRKSRMRTEYCNYSDDGRSFLNGSEETVSGFMDCSAVYKADLELTGEQQGEMKLRITFTDDGKPMTSLISRKIGEDGRPESYGYARFDGKEVKVEDMPD